jgi:glycosyltransferase involved in cell wall biosynthesis
MRYIKRAKERMIVVTESRIEEAAVQVPISHDRPRTATQLSLVIPAYNEERRLPTTLASAWAYLRAKGEAFELLLVDDGSSDATATIAESFAADHDGVRVLSIPHAGKAAAVRAGLLAATGDYVAFTDADLATPLSYLDQFIQFAAESTDVVIGSREGAGARRIGEPWYRHLMGRVFNRAVQLLVLPGIEDTQCGFKLFRSEAAEAVLARALLYRDAQTVAGPRVTAFDVELLVIARALGLKVVTVPVVWTYGSQSKVNPVRDTLYNARDIARVRLNLTLGRYRS